MNAEQILETLKTGMYTITFQKMDGSISTMVGYSPIVAYVRTGNVVPVIDMNTGFWKSFRVDRLISIEPFNPYL